MSSLPLKISEYPPVYQVLISQGMYSPNDEYEPSPVETPLRPTYEPPKITLAIPSPMTINPIKETTTSNTLPVPQRQNQSLFAIFCRCLCCCFRKKPPQNAPSVHPELMTRRLIQKPTSDLDLCKIAQGTELTARPNLTPEHLSCASSVSAFNYDSPLSLAESNIVQEVRKRADTEPVSIELLNALLYWRKSMIKDTILPCIPLCELIIKDRNFHELLILKNLFSKPENAHLWLYLKSESKAVLHSLNSERLTPILGMINDSFPASTPRSARAHTDPTPIRTKLLKV